MAASYPTSIKSFTTKTNNVDDVDAAHINDLQDEVVALETACGVGKSTSLIQRVRSEIATVVTCGSTIPEDNSIPQNSEGVEVTTVTITPKGSSNKLRVRAGVSGNSASAQDAFAAIFKDSGADAIAAGSGSNPTTNECFIIYLEVEVTAGGTSAITFKLRVGGDTSSNLYVNGKDGGSQRFGGKNITFLEVEEFKA